MYDVYIRFLDGTSMHFRARKFDINVSQLPTEAKLKQFYYKEGRQWSRHTDLPPVRPSGCDISDLRGEWRSRMSTLPLLMALQILPAWLAGVG